jgi:hypothetical protein
MVTGDYSRGASGLWIENGELTFAVEEVTIAGNLREMLRNITAIGNDLDFRGSVTSPTLRVDGMTVAGACERIPMLSQSLPFEAAHPEAGAAPAAVAQGGLRALWRERGAEPYIGVTPDLRRRLERLLRPAKGQTKRCNWSRASAGSPGS